MQEPNLIFNTAEVPQQKKRVIRQDAIVSLWNAIEILRQKGVR